jgi:hypothetical protein
MKVEILALCDAATADVSGKLNILGVFDRVYFQGLPAMIPLCALAIKIRFTQIEEGMKRLRISFMDADGRLVMPRLDAQTQIHVAPNETCATAQIVLVIPQLKLQSFGDYSIALAVDETEAASCPLFVRQAPLIPPMLQGRPPQPPQQPNQ